MMMVQARMAAHYVLEGVLARVDAAIEVRNKGYRPWFGVCDVIDSIHSIFLGRPSRAGAQPVHARGSGNGSTSSSIGLPSPAPAALRRPATIV